MEDIICYVLDLSIVCPTNAVVPDIRSIDGSWEK
jgi:hypothetical protein